MKTVFVSYARVDNESPDPAQRWLDRFLRQMKILQLQGEVNAWSDQQIQMGQQAHQTIQQAISDSAAAVLLVSDAFLASDYIRKSELPGLLKNAKDSGIEIIPIILKHCLWDKAVFKYPDPSNGPSEFRLSDTQAANDPKRPLNALAEHEQDLVLSSVARHLLELLQRNP